MSKTEVRNDRKGKHQAIYNKNRKRVLLMYDTCYICGGVVDKTLPANDPMAPEVDHIIPVSKLEPSDPRNSSLDNLCLTHCICNRKKGNKIAPTGVAQSNDVSPISSQTIIWPINWTEYRAK